jgi:hypothetical protein
MGRENGMKKGKKRRDRSLINIANERRTVVETYLVVVHQQYNSRKEYYQVYIIPTAYSQVHPSRHEDGNGTTRRVTSRRNGKYDCWPVAASDTSRSLLLTVLKA